MSTFFTSPASAGAYEIPVTPEFGGGISGTLRIPAVDTAAGRVVGLYHTGGSSWELCLCGVTPAEYAAYLLRLGAEGLTAWEENEINGNLFRTLRGGDADFFLSYCPSFDGTLRVVAAPRGYLPPREVPDYTKVCDSYLDQIVRRGIEQRAPGMSYVIRLEDGTFLLIDGGGADPEDEEALIRYLEEHSPLEGRPVVSAWLITHGHGDHMALANNFMARFHDRVDVRLFGYSFPTFETMRWCFDVQNNPKGYPALVGRFVRQAREFWPQAPHFVFHTGQKLRLANVQIEIYFTHEELFPIAMPYINHASAAFRLTSEKLSVFFPGDCEKMLCRQMALCYGPALKSDVLQVCHHGANGAVTEFYEAVDPDICLWPCSETLFNTDERMTGAKAGYEFNLWLRDESIKKREHFHSSAPAVLPL